MIHNPHKGDWAKQLLYSQLPYHPQRVWAGSQFDAVLREPGYLAIGRDNLSPWSKRVTARVERLMRFEGEQILPGDQLPPECGGLHGYIATADGGITWVSNQVPGSERWTNGFDSSLQFTRGPGDSLDQRGFLTSGGFGARVNLFGYLIAEADFVNAFDRPNGWHWQFSFQPGF